MPDLPASAVAPVVGVVVVGHGTTATALVAAARGIVTGSALVDIHVVDAGVGEDQALRDRLGASLAAADHGAGVLMITDVFGASPCSCGLRLASGHSCVAVTGLSLAMLLKLASLDRHSMSPQQLATACADTGKRAVTVVPSDPATNPTVKAPS